MLLQISLGGEIRVGFDPMQRRRFHWVPMEGWSDSPWEIIHAPSLEFV